MSEDEFGSDIEFTQELEDVLQAAETQPPAGPVSVSMVDIEDLVRLSPMEEFRKKGYLSVSDLVGTVWCEVQVSSMRFEQVDG
jgi:exonuclease V